jgi:hypothetical protein
LARSRKIDKTRTPSRLEEALDRYWRDESNSSAHVPDYFGFKNWLAEEMESFRSKAAAIPIHHVSGESSSKISSFYFNLIDAFERGGIVLDEEGFRIDQDRFGVWDGKGSKIKRFNKAKLLLHAAKDLDDRGRQFLVTLRELDKGDAVTEVSREATAPSHRAAFFGAISRGDRELAYKMVGRLRESNHDSGEIPFLEATAAFHANRFDEAIGYSHEVAHEHKDWSRACMLRIEAMAMLGSVNDVVQELQETGEQDLSPCFQVHAFQRAIENSEDPESSLRAIAEFLSGSELVISADDPFYRSWNRYSCEMAIRLVEMLRDREEAVLAIEQSRAPLEDSSDENLELSPSGQRLVQALQLDRDLLDQLLESESTDRCQAIVARLLGHKDPDRADYLDAFRAQWRIEEPHIFVSNIVQSMTNIEKDPSDDLWQLVSLAYQEALAAGLEGEAGLLRTSLLSNTDIAEKIKDLEVDAIRDALEEKLTSMGRHAYRSAKWDMDKLADEKNEWRDAGMISLGFFRILELEFNERLLLPMLDRLDLKAVGSMLIDLENGPTSKKIKKAIEFWRRMTGQLKSAEEQKRGLELGSIELLLGKCASEGGPDEKMKTSVHSALAFVLNSKGHDALRSGRLAAMVNQEARERFRNPPAHSRYVDIATALECRTYVEQSLKELISCVDSEPPDTSNIH